MSNVRWLSKEEALDRFPMRVSREQYIDICSATGEYPQGLTLTEYVERHPYNWTAHYQRLDFGKLT